MLMTLCSICSQSVTLHTDLGDVKIELFCERTPKSCEVGQNHSTLSVLKGAIIKFPTCTLNLEDM